MKKIFFLAASLAVCFSMDAQTMEDAINFSRNEYYGTAKSVGLGNAVTAVGGDLGMVGINPAASAVAGYSQFTITPGFAISTTASAYAPSYLVDHVNPSKSGSLTYGSSNLMRRSRFVMPNIGATLRYDNGSSALRSFTLGFISNTTSQFCSLSSSTGRNDLSTLTGCLATYADWDGMPCRILSDSDKYASGFNWNEIAAYHGGLINYNNDSGRYFGSAEHEEFDGKQYSYGLKGTLSQRSTLQKSGSKNDLLFNLGLNFNDNFFIGANIGIPVMSYRYDEYFMENAASDKDDFIMRPEYFDSKGKYVRGDETEFRSASCQYVYTADVDGVYFSMGAIWLPVAGLRLGTSFRTPTLYTVSETYQTFVSSEFAYGSESAVTDLGEYKYCLTSPYSFDFGAAYTFGPFGLVSLDYELTNYSVMHFSSLYDNGLSYKDEFYRANSIMRKFTGASHSLRAGVELKPFPYLALRAGYSFITDPRLYCSDEYGNIVDASWYANFFDEYDTGKVALNNDWKHVDSTIHSFSCGIGYISKGAFFTDFALRLNKYPTYEFNPYGCYIDNDDKTVTAPQTRTDRNLLDILFTLGWRF